GHLKLNVQELKVTTTRGEDVNLTPTEMRLLRYLMLNTGRTVARESLINSIWGCEYEGESNPVDVYIRRLRKKIERNPSRPELLQTVRGAGYRLLS
ncbi:MAG: helix-turn-helix domain-containing protein, partial [Dehalococcoidia bacterium]|nr:helix-turn-helix domain-containing protein [Dehalococcoidia bacterium]